MPNAIKMLQDDQNSARILFGQIQQVPAGLSGAEDKAALQLASMLSTHNTLVEEFIHPLLNKFEPAVADESERGYGQTRELLAEIEDLPSGMERRDVMVDLQGIVKAQGEMNESSVYPLLTEKLGVSGLEDLGKVMMARQQELLHNDSDTTGAASTAGPQVVTPKI